MEDLKKNFEVSAEWYYRVCAEVRETSYAYLRKMLEGQPNKRIQRDEQEYLDGIAVTYDGGNHPEYASCVISVVYAIYLDEKGNIMFDLEEEAVDIDRITTDDLVYIVTELDKNLYHD